MKSLTISRFIRFSCLLLGISLIFYFRFFAKFLKTNTAQNVVVATTTKIAEAVIIDFAKFESPGVVAFDGVLTFEDPGQY